MALGASLNPGLSPAFATIEQGRQQGLKREETAVLAKGKLFLDLASKMAPGEDQDKLLAKAGELLNLNFAGLAIPQDAEPVEDDPLRREAALANLHDPGEAELFELRELKTNRELDRLQQRKTLAQTGTTEQSRLVETVARMRIKRAKGLLNEQQLEELDINEGLLQKQSTITGTSQFDPGARVGLLKKAQLRMFNSINAGEKRGETLRALLAKIERLPGSVGFIGKTRMVAGEALDIIKQLGLPVPSSFKQAVSPKGLIAIQGLAKMITGQIVPEVVGDESGRYSDRDLERAKEVNRSAANFTGDEGAKDALRTLIVINDNGVLNERMSMLTGKDLRTLKEEGYIFENDLGNAYAPSHLQPFPLLSTDAEVQELAPGTQYRWEYPAGVIELYIKD